MPNQTASTNFTFHITANDSTGATLEMTGLEVLQFPAQTLTSNQYIAYALTGATNPALNKVPVVSSGGGTSPSASITSYSWLSPSEIVFTVNVGGGGTASTVGVTLAEPPVGWNCSAVDATTTTTTTGGYYVKPTAYGLFPATVTFTGYNASGTATAWTAQDILRVKCSVY
jgi:hypothetical protein